MHNRVLHIRIILGTEFQFKQKILLFWTKFSQKWYLKSKTEKMNSAYWILHIRINLGTKIHNKLKTSIFSTGFGQKGYSRNKTEKESTTTEICIIELDQVPNFSLNWKF